MQIKPEQLNSHLRKQLAPVYFISGDEPLRVIEAADAVRAAARAQGYDERTVLTVQAGFDWDSLMSGAGNLSLFSERRIIELRLPGGKPGDAGSRALRAYAGQPPEDTLLLISAGKLDSKARKAKWVQALDQAGVAVFVWPLGVPEYTGWVRKRMQACGLEPTSDAVELLADRVEGNLLACAQEIDKLFLLHGAGPVDAAAVNHMVADNARFDVYGLVDSALAGDGVRSARILQGLRAEGVAPPVVLWALAREIRQLLGMAGELARGQAVAAVLSRFRVWQSRKSLLGGALQRHTKPQFVKLLRQCAAIDRMIKGQAAGNPWDELLQLSLLLAGTPVMRDTY